MKFNAFHPVPGTEEIGLAADNGQYVDSMCFVRKTAAW